MDQMIQQAFALYDIPCGVGPARPDRPRVPSAYAFFCPRCSEVWLRAGVVGDKKPIYPDWSCFHIPCDICTEKDEDPSSSSIYLALSSYPELIQGLPTEILRNELELLTEIIDSIPYHKL